jgi:hypothetical protein
VLNLLRSCPYVTLEVAAQMHHVKDVEQLINDLQTIEGFK